MHAPVQNKLLVDVTSSEFCAQKPMEMESFQAYQMDCCERSKAALWTVWVPKSAEVFRRTPPLFINGDAEAYFMSIAILQSNQIRQLVTDSMDTYMVCAGLGWIKPAAEMQLISVHAPRFVEGLMRVRAARTEGASVERIKRISSCFECTER